MSDLLKKPRATKAQSNADDPEESKADGERIQINQNFHQIAIRPAFNQAEIDSPSP